MAESITIQMDGMEQLSLNSAALRHHPLAEISESGGHLLLLKLWQREEELFWSRIASKESKLHAIKREAFKISSLFFLFHSISFLLLFSSSLGPTQGRLCRGWWLPCLLSSATSLALISSLQLKISSYWTLFGSLQREKAQGRTLSRSVQDLRMKGSTFDLSKMPIFKEKKRSSSVEPKWRLSQCCSRHAISLSLLCFSALVFPAYKFILCG